MNILFINNIPFNPVLGGIERVTDILAKELIKKGYNIYYLCGNTNDRKLLEYNFPTKMNLLPEAGLFSSNINKSFYEKFIRENKIDIIINQKGLESFLNNSLEINDVKKITALHSKPKAYLNIYSKIISKPKTATDFLKTFIKICFYPYFYLRNVNKGLSHLSKQYNFITNKSDAIVLLSENYKEEFLSCDVKNINIPIVGIPNPNTYKCKNIKIENKEKIILYVGRLNTFAKKPQRLLKVWKKLYFKNQDWKVVIVGDGDAMLELQEYVNKHKLPRVYFEGKQSNVSTYYEKASIICLTSDFEGWGMSLTEGMCYGCIPITFNNYAAASEIVDRDCGCLIEPFDLSSYALQLNRIMSNDSIRFEMSKNALRKVKHFDSEIIVNQWESLFIRLLNNK